MHEHPANGEDAQRVQWGLYNNTNEKAVDLMNQVPNRNDKGDHSCTERGDAYVVRIFNEKRINQFNQKGGEKCLRKS